MKSIHTLKHFQLFFFWENSLKRKPIRESIQERERKLSHRQTILAVLVRAGNGASDIKRRWGESPQMQITSIDRPVVSWFHFSYHFVFQLFLPHSPSFYGNFSCLLVCVFVLPAGSMKQVHWNNHGNIIIWSVRRNFWRFVLKTRQQWEWERMLKKFFNQIYAIFLIHSYSLFGYTTLKNNKQHKSHIFCMRK